MQPFDEARVTGAQDDQPSAGVHQRGRARGDQVEALLRVETADQPEDRAAGVQAVALREVRAAGGLARRIVRREARGQRGVRGRIPEPEVDAVEDPRVAIAAVAQHVIHARAVLRT